MVLGMKLIGYVRVSSESQEENTSIESQTDRIKAYCLAFGHELVKVYVEVGSGKNMVDRPEFCQALEDLKTIADGVIAVKLDRIARNCRDVLALVEDVLTPMNKSLVLLDLQVDTSNPTGKMILTVMAAVAELERATINDRTQGGRKAKASKGGYAYGTPRFGQKAQDGELVNNDDELAVIEVIRRHHKSGKKPPTIARYLNENGYKTKRGKEWSQQGVINVLKRIYQD